MQFFTLAAVLLTAGLSATASPHAMPLAVVAAAADPVVPPTHPLYALQPFASRSLHGSGRRLSRKARRHGNHGGTTTMTTYTTISSDIPAASETGSCTNDGSDATTTVTEYITITQGTDVPTATESAPAETTPVDSSSSDSSAPTDSSSTETPSSTESSPQPTATGHSGVIQAYSEQCGSPNGTEQPTATGGPNGDENWLNCGVDGNGWSPPPVTLQNLVYMDLATVLQNDGNPFAPCSPYLSMFETMASETGVPTIFLASIALQESSCQPGVTGGAGEIGMMQITSEKCPTDGSDCYDAMTNIRIGAQYFKTVLDNNNGNLAATMGEYNGWYQGLTTTLANNYATCAQHNNLDYLQNVFNGYLQGVNPSDLGMGIYHNTC